MEFFRHPPIEIKFKENFNEIDAVRNVIEGSPNSVPVPEIVQLLRTGIFHHPQLGELKITPEMLSSMVVNFNNKARGIDIAIDYKHESDDVAAGWVKELSLSECDDGSIELWAKVKWTPAGLKKLHEREFRYLSADFALSYKDNETLEEFGPTLFGAGLTNRPVVKRMQPAVALTEIKPKGTEMSKELKDLQEKLEAVEKQNVELSEKIAKLGEDKKMEEEEKPMGEDKKMEEEEKPMQEEAPEEKPAMSPEEMMAKIKELEAELEKLRSASELAEKNEKFNALLSAGKTIEAQRESYLANDIVKFSELSGELNLKEKGSTVVPNKDNNASPEEKVLELAEALVKEKGLGLDKAIDVVLTENEELRKKYEAVFA